MTNADENWDSMLQYAKSQQQEYYELLPDWTNYLKSEYKYLRQNIGFSLFGPPTDIKDASTELVKCRTDAIIDQFHYTSKAEKIINAIYEKVCEFGEGQVEEKCIYFAIIFNITFRPKNESATASNSKDKKENNSKKSETNSKKEEKQNIVKKSETNSKEEEQNSEEPEINIQSTPIFKIKRRIDNKDKNIEYGEWYIDAWGRVYKSWSDYLNSNTLPKCTMVVPMDGFYQPDPSCEINEDYSTVWLSILESPECSITSNILSVIDTSSNVVSAVGLGLGIASMFTPLAPITIGALATSGISGLWTASRSVHHLVDRSTHEESISLTDRAALCSWLTVAGSAAGLAASGSSILLTKAVQNGSNVSNFVKIAYNTVVVSNLSLNGCGVAFRAYCMYTKYKEGEGINTMDVLSVGTHLLFFGNAVINFQFAGDLIESTQGKILDDYRSTLRSRRLRKAFNRTKRAAAENNTNKISENAEVIRYINKKMELRMQSNPNSEVLVSKNIVSFEDGKIIINGVTLMEPMKFVKILHVLDKLPTENTYPASGDSQVEDTFFKLKDLLIRLLTEVFTTRKSKNVPDIDEFDDICQDMKYMNDAIVIFPLIFKISITLAEHVYGPECIDKAIHFVWCYVKESLKQACLSVSFFITNPKIQKKISQIIVAISEHLDKIVDELAHAFKRYVRTI